MAKIIIHIGMHKTGTTAIQYSLGLNRDYLMSCGVAYPSFEGKFYHHGLVALWVWPPAEYRFPQTADKYWRALKSNYQDSSIVLISTEELSRFYPTKVDYDQLKSFISDFEEIKIVFSVRSQLDFIQSVYLEVRRGTKLEFSSFLEESLESGYATGLCLDYAELYNRVADVFGRKNVQVLNFRDLARSDVGLPQEFLRRIDLPCDLSGFRNCVGNPSENPLVYFAARAILDDNAITEPDIRAISSYFDQIFGENRKATIFSRDEIELISNRFAEANSKFEALVKEVDPSFSFPETSIRADYIFRDDISDSFLIQLRDVLTPISE